jgi:hypothetical protein
MTRGSYRTTCGARRPFYVQANGITQGSARDAATLAALIARVQTRKPGAALVVVSFGRNGERTERAVEQTALAA